MEVFPASVALIIGALLVSGRWAARSRRAALKQLTPAAEMSRVARLKARVAALENAPELREAQIEVLESRLGLQPASQGQSDVGCAPLIRPVLSREDMASGGATERSHMVEYAGLAGKPMGL